MCGRARLSSDVSEIKLVFGIPPERPVPNIAPSWNVAPTDPLPIVYHDARDGARRLEVMRWGLIPYWAKDIKIGFSTINARAEEVDNQPAFREAFQRRRCLVPVDNFYEYLPHPVDRLPALCGPPKQFVVRPPAGQPPRVPFDRRPRQQRRAGPLLSP
jgi:putative SOS response-associated peptidase YedK